MAKVFSKIEREIRKGGASLEQTIKKVEGKRELLESLVNSANNKVNKMKNNYADIFDAVECLKRDLESLSCASDLEAENLDIEQKIINDYQQQVYSLEHAVISIETSRLKSLENLIKDPQNGAIALKNDIDKWLLHFDRAKTDFPNEVTGRCNKCADRALTVNQKFISVYQNFKHQYDDLEKYITIVMTRISGCQDKFGTILEIANSKNTNNINDFSDKIDKLNVENIATIQKLCVEKSDLKSQNNSLLAKNCKLETQIEELKNLLNDKDKVNEKSNNIKLPLG